MLGSTQLRAQQQVNTDSLKAVRQRVADSTRAVLQHRTDSIAAIRKYKESKRYKDSVEKERTERVNALRNTRQQFLDSVNRERKRVLDSAIAARKVFSDSVQQRTRLRSDSLAAIRKYKESKRYQDSVTKSRNARLDSMRESRSRVFDSIRTSRQKVLDSAIAARKKVTDSLKAKQKIRTDSLAAIRKYKESRRYRDSVQVTRQSRLDSIKAVRKIYSDNIISTRKKTLDSLTKIRKQKLDSLTNVRKVKADSLKNARDLRADSLAKKKELREKQIKADQKKKEEKMKMALDLKIKKKHEAWSNEKMLKKKWGPVRQFFQNTFTRYNYYFNAKRKMEEANLNMVRRKKDNFEERIDLFPFDPNKDSTLFTSDMDTIIRKASVGIQIHDPRTKWADDLYLLMGQAYYYKGDYNQATAVFKYIIGMKNRNLGKKKKKNTKQNEGLVQSEKKGLSRIFRHQPVHNDAILWMTRTDADNGKEGEAEAILDLLDASAKLSERMKGKIALERAHLHIKKGEYREATRQLSLVVNAKAIDKYTRQRAAFLNGQLLTDMRAYDSAALYYKKTLALHPPIEMDFYARKNRASAVAESGGDQTQSIASLKHMLNDGKYTPYYEQVYFILGKLSANAGKTEDALENYQKSLQQPKTTRKQKAITFAAIGNIRYREGQYNLAKVAYDSASYFAKDISDNEELNTALRRGKALDKIKDPYAQLQLQDSLLKLAALSDKEQRAAVRRQLKYLEKLKQDSIANAESAANAGNLGNTAAPGAGGSAWYFSNQVAVQQGLNEFKRRWGNRTLTDNWRRASATAFGAQQNNGGAEEMAEDTTAGEGPTEESLLALIPKTEQQQNASRKKLKRAYLDLGTAYIKDVEEYKQGLATLDTLDKRYAGHEYPDEVLSLRYTAALRQGKLEEAEQYRSQLLKNYPNSEFAKTLAAGTEQVAPGTDTTQDIAAYYETTYQLALDRQYGEVLQRTGVAKRIFGNVSYSRKFRVLEALSLASTGQYRKADTALMEYTKEYPSDSLRPWIDAIQKNINEQKAADTLKKEADGSGAVKDSAMLKTIAADTTLRKVIPEKYTYKPKEAHYCIFTFGKPDAKIAGFRAGLSEFSRARFGNLTLEFSVEMLNAEQSMVITKGFKNAAQAKSFMNAARGEPLLFREIGKDAYNNFIISAENFLKLQSEKKLAIYWPFYMEQYK